MALTEESTDMVAREELSKIQVGEQMGEQKPKNAKSPLKTGPSG